MTLRGYAILLGGVLQAGVIVSCSLWEQKKTDSKEVGRMGETRPTQPEATPKVKKQLDFPSFVVFELDRNGKFLVPRPIGDKGLSISGFLASHAKNPSSWQGIEVELANGGIERVGIGDSKLDYRLFAHSGAGIDLVVQNPMGDTVKVAGPLRRVNISTYDRPYMPRKLKGKAVLRLIVDGDTVELSADELDKMSADGENNRMPLPKILTVHLGVKPIATIEVQTPKENTYFIGALLAEAQLFVGHSPTGELRLTVVRNIQGSVEKRTIEPVQRVTIRTEM